MGLAPNFTVADLASDDGLRFRCHCRVRTLRRDELVALVGADARLHLIRLTRALVQRLPRTSP